jgi:transglutaminase-like putative cysteine protease
VTIAGAVVLVATRGSACVTGTPDLSRNTALRAVAAQRERCGDINHVMVTALRQFGAPARRFVAAGTLGALG